jgi:hypothetical protein
MFPLPFHSPWFAVAGLVAAAGPILIHLLNRQRYRVVQWAAMDFLRQAIRRNRRILRLRDLLLLALRTLCVLAFGLALAQPYRQAATAVLDLNQPVHAVLIVDNSLSMSYQQLEGTLLDEAKQQAEKYIERLPQGSRFSILPLCGSDAEFGRGAYRTKEDAIEAVRSIRAVDRQATALAAIDLAKEACRRVTVPAAKQIVLLSDQQASNWQAESLGEDLKQLPSPMQIVRIGPEVWENAWVADVQIQDGLADLNVPAVFLATIRYDGATPRHDVQVTLSVDGAPVATHSVTLQPGQASEVRFPPYHLDVTAQPGKPTLVTAEVAIPHDQLAGDDQRVLVVPVVSSLPVVFVDQLGPDEDVKRGRYGETYRLRHLLAPEAAGGRKQAELIQVKHVTIDKLQAQGRELLEDARLVVVAGAASPGATVPLLREYVQQGGTVLVAAGASFDPVAWQEAAWQDGLGILPAPLKPEPVGRLPKETTGALEAFQLDYRSLMGEYFHIEQEPEEQLKDLYARAFFLKAVVAETGDATREELVRNLAAQIEKDRAQLAEIDRKLTELSAAGTLSETQRLQRTQWQDQRAQARPQWLLWADPLQGSEDAEVEPAKLAEKASFTVWARYDNGVPFLVERPIGRGRVLFVSSGVFREWNNMTAEYPVVVFDRIFRRALHRTLPRRTISTTERLVLPVTAAQRHARFALTDPAGREETLAVDALTADRYGLSLQNLPLRGIYRATAFGTREIAQEGVDAKLWQIPVAVNGPPGESELKAIDEAALQDRAGEGEFRWIARGQTISLTGGAGDAQNFWHWCILAVFAGLLLELVVLAWPSLRGGPEK